MTTRFDGESWVYEAPEAWICDVQSTIECKGGGGSQQPAGNTTTTSNSTSSPWEGQQPFLTKGFTAAGNLFDQGGPAYFPGQTLASTSPYTTQGIGGIASAAGGIAPMQGAAQNLTTNELNGSYLNSNPFLDQTYNHAADQLQSQMRSAFGGSDVNPNTNSSLQAATGQGLSDLGNQIYGNNYQQERTRQDQALALAPQTEQSAFTAPNALVSAGQAQQGVDQQSINDQINRYNYIQNLPYLNLQNYMGMIQGNYGGSATQTQTTPFFGPSAGAGALGGALGGAALGSMFMPGIGTLAGAGLGGLLGGIR